MSDRLPWFRCFPSALLGALSGMQPDEGYVYVALLLRIYETGGPVAETARTLSRRTGLSERKVATALDALKACDKILVLADGRIDSASTHDEIRWQQGLRDGAAKAGKASGAKRAVKHDDERELDGAEKTKENQRTEPTGVERPSNHKEEDREEDNNTPSLRSGVSDDGQKKVRSKPDDPEGFAEFWAAYPSRGDAGNPRKPARDKFAAAVKRGAKPEAIIAGAKAYAAAMDRAGKRGTEFVAQAATWLNQERWTDHAAPRQGDGSSVAGEISPRHQELKNQVWRMRVKDWLRDMHWPCTQESMPPDHPDTKVPDHILAEFNLTRRVRRPARPMLAVVGG